MCKLKTCTHMGKLAPTKGWGQLFRPISSLPSRGDKISSCRRHVQVENLHPHGKTCTHVSCGDKISSCRRHVQGENLHPHGKTCTHMGKLAATSLVATRFHLVGEVQVENLHPHGKTCTHVSCGDKISSCRRHVQVENLHPHGKTCTHMGKLAPTWENLLPQAGRLMNTWRA